MGKGARPVKTRLIGSNQYKTRSVETLKVKRDLWMLFSLMLLVVVGGREWQRIHPPVSPCPSEGCNFVVQVQAVEKKPVTKKKANK